MKILMFFAGLHLFLGFPTSVQAAENFILPAPLVLSGVGPIYGAVGGSRPWDDSSTRFLAGVSTGAAKAVGFGVMGIPLPNETGQIHLGFGKVESLTSLVDYSRGTTRGHEYTQEINGQAAAFTWQEKWAQENLSTQLGFVFSEIKIANFEFNQREVSRPNTSGYFPIRTTSLVASIKWDGRQPETQKGYVLEAGLTTLGGRTGQSDSIVFTESMAGYWPVREDLTLALGLSFSDSVVTKEQSRYTEKANVLQALDTRCGLQTDLEQRQICENLQNEVADNIVANNKVGTARPLGGSRGFRAAFEQRYRSAHTRILSLEARFNVRPTWWNLSVVPFTEYGASNDNPNEVYKTILSAWGAELRISPKDIPVRLGYAKSALEQSTYLTAGLAF